MNDRGFALPITIFLIAILTLMLGSTFTRAATENQIAGGSKATGDAMLVAQAGLQKYFGMDLNNVRPLSADSLRIDLPGGYAWIVPEVVRTPVDTMNTFRYIIRSTGYAADPVVGSGPLASHTVAQYADWQTAWLNSPPAAVYAPNGIRTIPGAGNSTIRIMGNDLACGATIPSIAAVRVPEDTVGQVQTYLDVTGAIVTGPLVPPIPTPTGSAFYWADQTRVQWDSILAGEFDADFTTLQNLDLASFSSQLIMGDLNVTSGTNGGSGLLIVTGDLNITGEYWIWEGIILVGGHMSLSTEWGGLIYGAVVSGLNHLTPDPAPNRTVIEAPTSIWGTPEMRVQFSSCYIQLALQPEAGFKPVANTFIDNWATF